MLLNTRRTALLGGLGLLGLGACSPRPGAGAMGQAGALRVATYKGQIDAVFGPANQSATAYPVRYSTFSGGNLITEAINAGAIDLGSMSEIPPIFSVGAQNRLRLVAVQRGDVNIQMALVPKDSAITRASQLRGKRVGYVRATTAHYFLLRMLEEGGLTMADVTPVALSPQDGLAAFGRGALDVWFIYGAPGYMARETFGARVLATGLGRFSGNYVWAALAEDLDDPAKTEQIGDYLRRVRAAWAWVEQNPEAWAAIVSRETGVPAKIFLQQFRERSEATTLVPVSAQAIASQQQVADAFAAAGDIPAKIDVTPLWSRALDKVLA